MEETKNINNPSPQQMNPVPTQDSVENSAQPVSVPPIAKKPFPKIIPIIIGVVILGVVIAFILNKNTASFPKTTQQSAEEGKTNKTVPKVRQPGFSTYSNNDSNFSIQYPDDLQVKEKSVGLGVSTVELRSEDNLSEDYLANIQMMAIPKYLAKTIGQDFDEYYKMDENTSKTIAAQDQSRVITKVKNRSINNQRAFEFISTDGSSSTDEEATIGVYVEIGDKILIITTQESNRAELEKMLSNFVYNP